MKRRLGQTVTEYLLTLTVIAIAAAAVTYNPLRDSFLSAGEGLSKKSERSAGMGSFGKEAKQR